MTKEALKLALEALEVANSCVDGYYIPKGKTQLPEVEEAITAIKESLAQTERPVDCERCNRLEDALKRANGLAEHFERAWYLRGDEIERLTAQPEQEPVAWATREDFYRELDRSINRMRQQMEIKGVVMRCADYDIALPVIDIREGHVLVGQVTSPAQRKPLTDEQIDEEFKLYASKFNTSSDKWLDMSADDYFKAGFKAAHGIKGEA